MTFQELVQKFNWSQGWNAFAYTIYKTLSTILTFLLYYHLTPYDFALWANLQCTVFLLVLWTDCGFRKSIPRFAPAFAHNKHALRQFLQRVVLFQVLILTAIIPIFLFTTLRLLNTIPLILITLGCLMYIFEGIIATFQHIFHAYFWNKQFNLLVTSLMIAQMALNLAFFMHIQNSNELIYALLLSKISASLLIIFTSFFMLNRLIKKEYDPSPLPFDSHVLTRQFIKHSALMWGSSVIKSLSERNFLVPFLTATLGPSAANMFKVANDGALFFYRIIIKTVGNTDTALLSHVETSPEKHAYMHVAFKKLRIRMATFCIPVAILVGMLYISSSLHAPHVILSILTFMAIAYLIESLFLPYERILEVKQHYWYLFYSYFPYACIILLFISGNFIHHLGLLESIIIIHCVRLMSLFLMIFFVRKLYATHFQLRFILIILATSLSVAIITYPLLSFALHKFAIFTMIIRGYS